MRIGGDGLVVELGEAEIDVEVVVGEGCGGFERLQIAVEGVAS